MNYVPRGYLTTADAVGRVFQAQHPDLAGSASARQAEIQRLDRHYRAEFPGPNPPPATLMDAIRLRDAASRRNAIIVGSLHPRDALRHTNSRPKQPDEQPGDTFGEEDLARLRQLIQGETEQRHFESEAEVELRAALAEGDLTADVLTETGAWVPLDRSHWLGKDGLTTVRRSRLRVQVPGTHTPPVDGTVVIKEDHLMNWMGSSSSTNGERGSPSKIRKPMAAETPEEKMTVWLTKLMRDQPNDPIAKAAAHALAVNDSLQRISDRGFENRAWPNAIKASGATKWGDGGRRKNRRT